MWREAGGGGVHCGEQTVQSGVKVSLHAHEERDEVLYLLEAAGEKKNQMQQVKNLRSPVSSKS